GTVAAWVERLNASGAGAHAVTGVSEVIEDSWVRAHGLALTREHDDIGLVTTTGPAPRLSRFPVRVGRPAPRPGSDGEEILAEIGMRDQAAEFIQRRIVVTEGV